MNNEKFCIKCGKKIISSAVFCPFCGSNQEEVNNTVISNEENHTVQVESLFVETTSSEATTQTRTPKSSHIMGYDSDYEDTSTNRTFSVWVWIGWVSFFFSLIPSFIFSLLTIVSIIIGITLFAKGNKRFSNHGVILMCASLAVFVVEMLIGFSSSVGF